MRMQAVVLSAVVLTKALSVSRLRPIVWKFEGRQVTECNWYASEGHQIKHEHGCSTVRDVGGETVVRVNGEAAGPRL